MIPWLVAAGIGALLVVSYWDEITSWLKSFCRKVASLLENRAVRGAVKIFAVNHGLNPALADAAFEVIHRLFYREGGDWWQEDTTARVNEREVPQWAKSGVTSSETDVTQKYQRELQLTL